MLNMRMSATALATSLLIVGCATKATKDASAAEPRWQANGYLSPGRTDNPEIIGQFANKKDCDAAAKFWMQRQVVGNPIFAECLPIDTH